MWQILKRTGDNLYSFYTEDGFKWSCETKAEVDAKVLELLKEVPMDGLRVIYVADVDVTVDVQPYPCPPALEPEPDEGEGSTPEPDEGEGDGEKEPETEPEPDETE